MPILLLPSVQQKLQVPRVPNPWSGAEPSDAADRSQITRRDSAPRLARMRAGERGKCNLSALTALHALHGKGEEGEAKKK